MRKFQRKSDLEHLLRIFEKVISNTKRKAEKSGEGFCVKKYTDTKKFYIPQIAAVNLSTIYFLKDSKKACKPNNAI